MNGSGQKDQFRDTMTELAGEVLDPGDRRVYDIVVDNSNPFHEFFDCVHGGAAYVLWENITDLLSDPFGPGSEQLCHEIGQKAASEWMKLDRTSQAAIDASFSAGAHESPGTSSPSSSDSRAPRASKTRGAHDASLAHSGSLPGRSSRDR